MAYGTVVADQIQTSVSNTSLGAGNATSFKNRIINGAMQIDQRNAGASVNIPSGGVYTLDRWSAQASQSSKFTVQQGGGNSTITGQGFNRLLQATSSSAYTLGAGDYFQIQQYIEGYNIADLAWGNSSAKTVTLSFWVYATIAGTYGMFLVNDVPNRVYPTTYTVNNANTWEQKTITIAGDTSGSWQQTNSTGVRIAWTLGYGSTYTGATPNAWATLVNNYVPSGCVSLVGTSGAVLAITGVQFEVGSFATGFDYRSIGTELALCQRYFIKTNPDNASRSGGLWGSMYTTTNASLAGTFNAVMRAAPTFTRGGTQDSWYISSINGTSAGTLSNGATTTTGFATEVGSMSSCAIGYPVQYNGQANLNAEL
jgi:hypothetical protein